MIGQVGGFLVVVEKIYFVDYCDYGIQLCYVGQVVVQFVVEGEGFGYWYWFGNFGGFDQQVVEVVFLGEMVDFFQQVFVQGVVDIVVVYFYQVFFSVVQVDIVLDFVVIDIDFVYIVDDYCNLVVFVVFQQMVEQCVFVGVEKVGQYGDRQVLVYGW